MDTMLAVLWPLAMPELTALGESLEVDYRDRQGHRLRLDVAAYQANLHKAYQGSRSTTTWTRMSRSGRAQTLTCFRAAFTATVINGCADCALLLHGTTASSIPLARVGKTDGNARLQRAFQGARYTFLTPHSKEQRPPTCSAVRLRTTQLSTRLD